MNQRNKTATTLKYKLWPFITYTFTALKKVISLAIKELTCETVKKKKNKLKNCKSYLLKCLGYNQSDYIVYESI